MEINIPSEERTPNSSMCLVRSERERRGLAAAAMGFGARRDPLLDANGVWGFPDAFRSKICMRGWARNFIGARFALELGNREESGIGCHRGVPLGDCARKEMEEDADLRGPPVGDRRRGSGRAVAQGKSCARLDRGVGPHRGGRDGPHFGPR